MTKDGKHHGLDHAPHTDKRTGIVYTNADIYNRTPILTTQQPKQPHIDAFIPDSFLKHYFNTGKSKSVPDSI